MGKNKNLEENLFKEAKKFLIEKLKAKNIPSPEKVIESYLKPQKYENLNDIYKRLALNSLNKSQGVALVKKLMDVKNESLAKEFDDYKNVLEKKYDYEKVLEIITKNHKDDKNKKSIISFAKTIVDSAKFIGQFKDYSDFESLVKKFINERNGKFKYGLAFFIASQVHEIGFALACDFLKEIGFEQFAKPDVHIKRILNDLGLIEDTKDNLAVVLKVDEIAKKNGVTPYALDKLLWLIGSGNFYKHKQIKMKGSIIEFADIFKK